MCTVTFFPLAKDEFVLTSNRDEMPERVTIPPAEYVYNEVKLTFPKDQLAGGTWIGYSERKRALMLMNGGFESHERKLTYRLSRGIIALELLAVKNISKFLKKFDFQGIEPFTIILFDYKRGANLYQIVWDEVKIHLIELELKPHIWSSTPLYDEEMRGLREDWLNDFLATHKEIKPADIWKFHETAGNGNAKVNLVMDRGFIHTKSTTQITIKKKVAKMQYLDRDSTNK